MAEITLTKQNFEEEVLRSDKPVLVDFWATWCGPCRMVGPIVEELAKEYEGRVKVGKVNVDEEMELAQRFRISSIPSLLIFRNGAVVQTMIGFRPKEEFTKVLDTL